MENHPPVLQRGGAVGPRPRQVAVLPRQEGGVIHAQVPAAQPLQPVIAVAETAARHRLVEAVVPRVPDGPHPHVYSVILRETGLILWETVVPHPQSPDHFLEG